MKSPIQVVIDIKNSSRINLGNVAIRDTTNIEITLIDNSIPVKFTSPVFELHIKKYDGNFIRQTDRIKFVDNKVSINLWDQANVCPGIVYCELLIKDGGRSTTSKFYFVCKKTLDSEIIESIRDVETLDNLDSWLEQSNLELEKFKLYVEILTNSNVSLEALLEIKDFMSINLDGLKIQNIQASKNNEMLIEKNNEAEEKITELDKRDLSLAEIKEENIKASTNTTNLDRENTEATTNISNLDSKNNAATNNVKNLDSKNTLASTNIKDLDSKNSTAADNITKLATKNTDAVTNLENLNVSIEEAKEIKIATDEIIASGSAVTVTKFKEEIDKTNTQLEEINTEVTDASVDFSGEENNNLKERLAKDFGDVHDRINNAEIMELEGSGLSAKTFAGYTKEMEIKGKTWQNLAIGVKGITNSKKASIRFKTHFPFKVGSTYSVVYRVSKMPSVNVDIFRFHFHNTTTNKEVHVRDTTFTPTDVRIGKTVIKTFKVESDWVDKEIYWTQYGALDIPSGEYSELDFLMILEGDYTNKPIPDYFEGIQSTGEAEMVGSKYKVEVESSGKNLFNLTDMYNRMDNVSTNYIKTINGIKFISTSTVLNEVDLLDHYKQNTTYSISHKFTNEIPDKTGWFIKARYTDKTVSSWYNQGNGVKTFSTDSTKSVSRLSISYGSSNLGTELYDIQIEEGTTPTPYEPHKKDNTYYLLDEPLRSLPSGVEDTISPRGILTRRIGKYLIDGSESFNISAISPTSNTIKVLLKKNIQSKTASNGLCSTIPFIAFNSEDFFHFRFDGSKPNSFFIFWIEKTKLSTLDLDGIKKWLQENLTTVYYELAEPIMTDLKKKPILKVYDGLTYISSTNSIKADLMVKLPVNVNTMLQDTIKENKLLKDNIQALELENREVNEKQNSSLNILSDMDTNLVSTSWDMDFRLMEVEFFVEDNLPKQISTDNKIKNNRGGNVMALSRFEQAKIMILGGVYVRETLEYQLNVYLKRGYMTKEEVDELIAMMDARELVEGK